MTRAYRVLLPEALYVLEGIVFSFLFFCLKIKTIVQFNYKKKVVYI